MKKILSAALLLTLSVSFLSGCSIYRLSARQGNEVTADKLTQLEAALTREQVLEIMGTPLVNDPFRDDRWDYVYYLKKHNQAADSRRLTVFFNGELVDRIEQDGIPAEPASETEGDINDADAAADGSKKDEAADTGAQGSDNL